MGLIFSQGSDSVLKHFTNTLEDENIIAVSEGSALALLVIILQKIKFLLFIFKILD